MDPAVVKAATVRFELGLEPMVKDDEIISDDDEPSPKQDKKTKSLVWGEGVAATDGNSAQKLHEVHLKCIYGEISGLISSSPY